MSSLTAVPRELTVRRLLWLVVVVMALAGAAATGPVLTVYVAAVVATLASAWHGAGLVRLALEIHTNRMSFGPCRGAGFLGLGVLFAAAATLGTAVTATTLGVDRAALAPAIGALSVAPMYLLGLLLLPGAAPTLGARLRRLVDGIGIAASVLFAAWLLLRGPASSLSPLFTAAVVTCSVTIAIAVVTGVRAVRHRPAALGCAVGAALSMLGLTGLAVEVDATAEPAWLAAAALALVTGPLLIVEGARRAGDTTTDVDAFLAGGTFAGYPLLAVPVGVAIAATAYHFASGRTFDTTAVVLGIAGVSAVAVREALAALDVRRYARRLASQEAHFRSLVSGSTDVIMVLDDELVIRWQSPAAARQFGLSDQDVLGTPFVGLLHADDAPSTAARLTALLTGEGTVGRPVEARLRDGFGAWREIESTVSDQRDTPSVGGLVVHLRDIGDRTTLRRSLDRMTWTDELTGLANRRKLVAAAADRRGRDGGAGALLVVRLDRFAGVADLHGAAVADAVLGEAARRLGGSLAAGDLPARLSGNEFAVLTDATLVRAYTLATKLLTVLAEPYALPGATVHLSADIGVADLRGGADVEEVLRHADLARRRARQLGRGRAECYDASFEAVLVRRTQIEQHLPGLVERGELDLVFQPVLDLIYRQPVGTEALLRWRHPRLGQVAPAEFLPVASELGLAQEIGRWTLHQACRQLSRWRRDGRDLWMSVNVSGAALADPGLLATVATVIDTHCVPADKLVVEVELAEPDPSTVDKLAGLKALGVRTAIDHFGTGSAALAHLRRLPVDLLKIDRELFSEPAGLAGDAQPIVDVVVGLAERLGIEVIAIGLEAETHVDVVRAAGCRLGQGYLLVGPNHAEHIEAFFETSRSGLY